MGAKTQTADPAFPQDVRITNTQAHVFDSLIGIYGSTRGDVMNSLIQLGLLSLKGKRTLADAMEEAGNIRQAAPDLTPPRLRRKKDEGTTS